MADPTVRGIVHLIEETKSYGQKGFRKRLVVIEQDSSRFVNYIPLEFIQDGCDSVDELSVGDEVEITYRLSGRKWQKDSRSEVKFFLSAEAIRFKKIGDRAVQSSNPGDLNEELSEAATDQVFDPNDVPF